MKKTIPVLILITMLLSACEQDLEMAEYKELTVVYGLINIKDTAQYLRINRGYSTSGNAYQCTQINDSVNYPYDQFDVYLEEYHNGVPVGEPIAYFPVDRQKEPGLFSNESNCVYKTNAVIHEDGEYKLRLVNKINGNDISGKATVLGTMSIEESFLWERSYYLVDYYAERLPEYEGSLDHTEHDNYIVRFLYWEYKNGNTYYKYVDWIPTMDPLKVLDEDTTYQLFDAYWQYLSENIEVDPSVKRRARGVDYMLALPGMELQNYIEVNEQPTNPHFFPNYSNIENGYGIFGSKYYYTYFGLKLKKRTVDTISWGRYLINHRFADSKGEWH